MKYVRNNQTKAAQLLGLNSTLQKKAVRTTLVVSLKKLFLNFKSTCLLKKLTSAFFIFVSSNLIFSKISRSYAYNCLSFF